MKRVKSVPSAYVSALSAILHSCHFRFGLMFDIGVECGLRIGDILALKASDFSGERLLYVTEQKTGKTKEVELSQSLRNAIKIFIKSNALTQDEYIIFSNAYMRSKPLSRTQAYRIMVTASKSLKLTDISPHSMRKTYARNLYAKTGNIRIVQEALNHSNLATTVLYLFDDLEGFGIDNTL